jgi:hypothetical protein
LRRDGLRKAAESIRDFDLGIGDDAKASFGPGKRQAESKVYFTTAEDGRFVRLPEEDWKKRWGR